MALFEISSVYAPLIALLLIVIPLLLVVSIHYLLKSRPSNRVVRYLNHLVSSPSISYPTEKAELPQSEKKLLHKRTIAIKLALAYGGILLFVVGNLIAEFFLIFADVSRRITQGSTGAVRTWSSIVIENPFSGGWMGSLPWYTSIAHPLGGFDVYHDVWEWVYFTGAFTDNHAFFPDNLVSMILITSIIGLLILLPLKSKRVRETYTFSLFYLVTSMLVITRSFFSCFAQAWNLQFNGAVIQFGLIVVNGNMTPFTNEVFILTIPFIILFYVLFMGIGWKLSRTHYSENTSYRRWFLVFLTLVYWMSLVYSVAML